MLSVPVSLQDITHLDLVDTAAAVTIISDSIFREPKPPYLEKVVLHIAYSFPVCSVFFFQFQLMILGVCPLCFS